MDEYANLLVLRDQLSLHFSSSASRYCWVWLVRVYVVRYGWQWVWFVLQMIAILCVALYTDSEQALGFALRAKKFQLTQLQVMHV